MEQVEVFNESDIPSHVLFSPLVETLFPDLGNGLKFEIESIRSMVKQTSVRYKPFSQTVTLIHNYCHF